MVGNVHDQIDIVLNQEHGDASGQRLDECIDFRCLGRRHALRRLVEHQDSGRERHTDRDLDPALITMREIADQFVGAFVEPEFLENLGRPPDRRR